MGVLLAVSVADNLPMEPANVDQEMDVPGMRFLVDVPDKDAPGVRELRATRRRKNRANTYVEYSGKRDRQLKGTRRRKNRANTYNEETDKRDRKLASFERAI